MGEVEPEVEVSLDLQNTLESNFTIKTIYKAREGERARGEKEEGEGTSMEPGKILYHALEMSNKRWGVKPTSLDMEIQTANSLRYQC